MGSSGRPYLGLAFEARDFRPLLFRVCLGARLALEAHHLQDDSRADLELERLDVDLKLEEEVRERVVGCADWQLKAELLKGMYFHLVDNQVLSSQGQHDVNLPPPYRVSLGHAEVELLDLD